MEFEEVRQYIPGDDIRLIDWNVKRLKSGEDWRDHFWRVVERPALLSRACDVIIFPTASDSQEHIAGLWACGYDIYEFKTGLTALVKRDSDIQSLDDLNHRPIAVARGLAWERIAALQARLEGSCIDVVETHDEALARLRSDQAAALVAGRAALTGLTQLHPEYRLVDENPLSGGSRARREAEHGDLLRGHRPGCDARARLLHVHPGSDRRGDAQDQ